MPTDETTLEALDLSHIRRRTVAERDYWINQLVIEVKRLRALLAAASLTAPAAQDTAEMLALLDGADGSGCGPDDTFTLYLPLHRARRLHALVAARIAHDEEARSAASLPRRGDE